MPPPSLKMDDVAFSFDSALTLLETVVRQLRCEFFFFPSFYCFNLGLDGAKCSWRRGSGGSLPYCSSQLSPTHPHVKGQEIISAFTSNRPEYPSRWDVWANKRAFRARADETHLLVITRRQRQQAQAHRRQLGLGSHCCGGGGEARGDRRQRKQNVNLKLSADLLQRSAGMEGCMAHVNGWERIKRKRWK